MNSDSLSFFSSSSLLITKIESGETKEVDYSLFDTFEEGKKILALGNMFDLGTHCSDFYEQDGEIYLTYLYQDGFLGNPCHFFILKYDFEQNTLSYYTSLFFEEYQDHVSLLYIPEISA